MTNKQSRVSRGGVWCRSERLQYVERTTVQQANHRTQCRDHAAGYEIKVMTISPSFGIHGGESQKLHMQTEHALIGLN